MLEADPLEDSKQRDFAPGYNKFAFRGQKFHKSHYAIFVMPLKYIRNSALSPMGGKYERCCLGRSANLHTIIIPLFPDRPITVMNRTTMIDSNLSLD